LLEILIKIYRPNTNIHFPEGGKLTPYLENLKPGDFINADGPHGKFSYSRGYIKIA
jgi:ferredoxin-NADP reductase